MPLATLALAASYYSEYNYQREIQREIITNLNRVAMEVQHELQSSQNLVLGISRAAAIKSFLPILSSIKNDEHHPSIRLLRKKTNRYLEGFQTIIPGDFTIRILDHQGDTFIKVNNFKVSPAQYESLLGINYVEHQLPSLDFVSKLEELPRNEVSFFTFPHPEMENASNLTKQLHDYVVPLYEKNNWVGSLVVTLSGGQIDRIVNNIARLYQGKIFIAENNPDNFNRHGLLLFDDHNNLNFADDRITLFSLTPEIKNLLFKNVIEKQEGLINKNNNFTYYTEFYPYPNRLLGWVLGIQIDEDILSAPYANNRLIIWLIAAAALFLTLIMTAFAVRNISKPICHLASQLKSFADGKHDQRANTGQNIAEIKVLSSSFNYMADTLISTLSERDKAQNMALQNNKLASIGQMAAGIGHEINNPLNNILSYSKLISRSIAKNAGDIDTKSLSHMQDDIDSLRSETLRASEIIKGILNFSRQMPPQISSILIKDWLNHSVSLVMQMAKTQHININLNYNGNDSFEADQAQLQQVIINLLLNSIQASENDTEINIDVKYDNEQVKVIITDQGSGISEEYINNIYDPFFSTKEEGEGSGLGLSISLGIIESHNGFLSIKNNPENSKGTTTTIVLPNNHN